MNFIQRVISWTHNEVDQVVATFKTLEDRLHNLHLVKKAEAEAAAIKQRLAQEEADAAARIRDRIKQFLG